MRNTNGKVVLKPDLYDVLELGALVHGGIGSGCLSEDRHQIVGDEVACEMLPVCVMGLTLWLDGNTRKLRGGDLKVGPVTRGVAKAFGFEPEMYTEVFAINDDAVTEALEKRGVQSLVENQVVGKHPTGEGYDEIVNEINKRITFKQWCKAVGVVRGEARQPRLPANVVRGDAPAYALI